MQEEALRDFNKLLIDSVDEAVTEVLGPQLIPMFWKHYRSSICITREVSLDHSSKLFEFLQTMFGGREETVGERVLRKLYAKADIPLNYSPRRPLAEYAEELKQILDKENASVEFAD